jgi:YHS domain-containing protein
MSRNFILIAILSALVSCHERQPAAQNTSVADSSKMAAAARLNLKSLHFDYAKDPACGMPLKAGLEDTTHYKGKLYGFCSKECKEAFLKDPATYLAQAK